MNINVVTQNSLYQNGIFNYNFVTLGMFISYGL